MKKREPYKLLMIVQNGVATMEHSMAVLQKIKTRATI